MNGSGGSTINSLPYLADFDPSMMTGDDEDGGGDGEATASVTAKPPAATAVVMGPHPEAPAIRHQETDMPLQLSDILPTDRRSYDKMEPPKREGTYSQLTIT